jgi:hypothetical protein
LRIGISSKPSPNLRRGGFCFGSTSEFVGEDGDRERLILFELKNVLKVKKIVKKDFLEVIPRKPVELYY